MAVAHEGAGEMVGSGVVQRPEPLHLVAGILEDSLDLPTSSSTCSRVSVGRRRWVIVCDPSSWALSGGSTARTAETWAATTKTSRWRRGGQERERGEQQRLAHPAQLGTVRSGSTSTVNVTGLRIPPHGEL